MKFIRQIIACVLVVALVALPATVSNAGIASSAAGLAGQAAVGLATAAPAAAAFAIAHPYILVGGASGGVLLVATGLGYAMYKANSAIQDAAWTTVLYSAIPLSNKYWLAPKALAENKAGTLDLSITLSNFFSKIPVFGRFFGPSFNDGQLHDAINAGRTDVAHILIDRHQDAGVDLNKEHSGQRPLHAALQHGDMDQVAESLIKQDSVNLGVQGSQTGSGNPLAIDVILSGKIEHIAAAVKRSDATVLLDLADANGNSVPTHAAVSPGLRDVIPLERIPKTAYDHANRAGKKPLDAAMWAQAHGHADATVVGQYLDIPGQLSPANPMHFDHAMASDSLRREGIPEKLLQTGANSAIQRNPQGQTPLDIAIARGDDAQALRIAQLTPDGSLEQTQMGRAFGQGMPETFKYLAEKRHLLDSDVEKVAFYSQPLGDGRTAAQLLIENPALMRANPGLLKEVVTTLDKAYPQSKTLQTHTAGVAGLLAEAAERGNAAAVKEVLEIVKQEGFFENRHVLEGPTDNVVPVLLATGHGEALAKAGEGLEGRARDDYLRTIGGAAYGGERRKYLTEKRTDLPRDAAIEDGVEVRLLELPAAGDDGPNGAAAGSVLALQADGRALELQRDGSTKVVSQGQELTVRDRGRELKYAPTEEVLAEVEERQAKREEVAEHMREDRERRDAAIRAEADEDAEKGLPKETKTKRYQVEPRIEIPALRQQAFLAGYFATNVIDQRSSIKHLMLILPGIDKIVSKPTLDQVTDNHEFAWGLGYFASSLGMSWGANTGLDLFSWANLKNAGWNTAGYIAKRWLRWTPDTENLPEPDQRGIGDFLHRFLPAATANAGLSIGIAAVQAGLLTAVTGAALGPMGIMLPAAWSIGADLVASYDIYANHGVTQSEEKSFASTLTPYIIAAGTVGYYYNTFAASVFTNPSMVTHGTSMVQNLFGALMTFATSHKFSSIVVDQLGAGLWAADKKVSGILSGTYERVFGSSTADREL